MVKKKGQEGQTTSAASKERIRFRFLMYSLTKVSELGPARLARLMRRFSVLIFVAALFVSGTYKFKNNFKIDEKKMNKKI